jgi:toxin YoeB
MKRILFTPTAESQFEGWSKEDKRIYNKIIDLIEAIQDKPFEGIGKPEALKYQLKGFWSRRINKEHRLVYQVTEEDIIIISCKFHY